MMCGKRFLSVCVRIDFSYLTEKRKGYCQFCYIRHIYFCVMCVYSCSCACVRSRVLLSMRQCTCVFVSMFVVLSILFVFRTCALFSVDICEKVWLSYGMLWMCFGLGYFLGVLCVWFGCACYVYVVYCIVCFLIVRM